MTKTVGVASHLKPTKTNQCAAEFVLVEKTLMDQEDNISVWNLGLTSSVVAYYQRVSHLVVQNHRAALPRSAINCKYQSLYIVRTKTRYEDDRAFVAKSSGTPMQVWQWAFVARGARVVAGTVSPWPSLVFSHVLTAFICWLVFYQRPPWAGKILCSSTDAIRIAVWVHVRYKPRCKPPSSDQTWIEHWADTSKPHGIE